MDKKKAKLLSDLPSHIWSEFSIYGDLDNERTEIDSELAFGFLKMGSSLYRLFTFYLLFTKMSHFVSYIQYEAQFFLKNMNLEIFAHTKYWNRTSKANFVNFSLLHLLKHKKMETIWRRSTFICRILKCVKTGDIWTHCCTTPDPWFHSMYLYTHIIDSKLNHYKKITFYHDQTHINFWQFWTQLRYDVDVDGKK